MLEIKPPNHYEQAEDQLSIFIAGSIEMGKAENWQDKFVSEITDDDVIIYNPRRDDWDSSWVQSIDNPQFKNQVEWELKYLDLSDIKVFYFDPNTKSPITMAELGLIAGWGDVGIVYCPMGFWRKGNVDIMCVKFGIKMVSTWEDLIAQTRKELESCRQSR